MVKSAKVIASDGVKILRPSLDDLDKETILRGILSLDSLPNLRVDYYQRERLSTSSNRQIQRAIDTGVSLPDITLGMRGDKFEVDDDGSIILIDPVFIIDGQQRVGTIKAHVMRYPDDKIRLGAAVHFNTNEFSERQRFHALNLFATKVSSNVILRNNRQDNALLAAMYGLSTVDRDFPMYRRVCWKQIKTQDELTTAGLYVMVNLFLHGHLAATRRTSQRTMMAGLDSLMKAVGIQLVRENVITFWSLIENSWGIRELSGKTGVPYMKGGFLLSMVRVLSDHLEFWEGHRLVIPPEYKKRFKLFKPYDPEIARLSASAGAAREMLRLLMIEHLNSRMRKKLTARLPVVMFEDEAA